MAKVTKSTANSNIVVQNIVIKSPVRKTQDIDNWRNAIKQFENLENPNRTLLYELYDDIMLDGHIEGTWGKRTDAILNKELIYIKDGIEDEEINKILNSPHMRSIVRELHKSIAYGFTLLQINDILFNEEEEQYIINFDLIPRKHVHPERKFECVSKEQAQITKDILFKEPPLGRYMIWAGEPDDLGLLAKAAQYIIYKRGDFGDWAQFAEMFGMPFREGRYDDYDDNTRVALEKAMEAYGGATYAILPKNAEFKIHDNAGTSGSSTLYKDLYMACNTEISKIILGNTLTTEQGTSGSRSLGEVHQTAEDNKYKSDEKLILNLLNGKFKAILKLFGFNINGGQIWFKSPDEDWTILEKKWNVINGIANRIPIDDDFIYEEFDIPKPENYESLKAEMQTLNTVEPVLKENLKADKKSLIKNITDFFV